MPLSKESIDDGNVRYYDTPGSVAEVLALYSDEEQISITSFSIRDAKLADATGLSALANVDDLALGNCRLKEVEELASLSKLTCLSIDQNKLKEVRGLGSTALTHLDAQQNAIASLASIDPCLTLTDLNLSGCKLQSLSGIEQFPSLESLNVHGNPMESLDLGSEFASLRTLEGNDLKLESTHGLRFFPGLKRVTLGSEVRVIAELEHLPNLEKLQITGPIEEISPESLEVLVAMKTAAKSVKLYGSDDLFERYPALKIPPRKDIKNGYLNYRGEPMTVAGLAALYTEEERASVESLSLSGCSLSDTVGINLFPNLESLALERNEALRSVAGIGTLEKLRSLDISSTGVTSVSGIEANSGLESIKAERAALESLGGLAAFDALKELDVSNNKSLTDANPGGSVPSLETLLLSDCGLETMEGLSEWYPSLKKLSLKYNPFKHIQGLSGLPQLAWLEFDDEVESADDGSIAKVKEMLSEQKWVRFGWGSSAPFLPDD